jgi:hypothetical protein
MVFIGGDSCIWAVLLLLLFVSGKKRGVFVSFGIGKSHVSNHVIVYHICIATFLF